MSAKAPVILQGEAAECGLTCLAMIAAAHGDRRGLPGLRQRAPASLRGMSLDRIVAVADGIGLAARALRIEPDDLPRLQRPALLHWETRHFVVLVGCDRRGIVIHDPALGRRHVRHAEVARCFTGVAVEFWPDARFEPVRKAPTLPWKALLGPFSGMVSPVARIVLLAMMLELMVIAAPLFMQGVIDQVLVTSDAQLLGVLAGGFLAMLTLQTGLSALRAWSATALVSTCGLLWQGRLFRHLLHLPLAWFQKRSLGDVLSRFESLRQIQRTLGSSFVEACMDGLMAVVTLGLMLAYSPLLALVSLASMGAYLGLRGLLFVAVRDRSESALSAGARLATHSAESIRGIQTLKLHGGQADRLGQWRNLLADSINHTLALERYGISFRSAAQWLNGGERIVVVWLAALAVMRQEFSVGMLIAYLAYRDQFCTRFSAAIDRLMELRLLGLHGERLADITACPLESHGGVLQVGPLESIEARALGFRYAEGEPWVARDLEFKVTAGETVAIVGPSGSGKSTIVKLLLGLLQPEQGSVEINGRPLAHYDVHGLRRLCASVMQDDQLFAGSIAENIAFLDPEPDIARIERAAGRAAIDQDIRSMPMGYATLVGDMGSTLSGGQKQRILLARALYREPQLLVLDEATSQLDLRNESLVNAAIRALPMTKIVVAHRRETIEACDRVLVLRGGRLVEEGPAGRLAAAAIAQAA